MQSRRSANVISSDIYITLYVNGSALSMICFHGCLLELAKCLCSNVCSCCASVKLLLHTQC